MAKAKRTAKPKTPAGLLEALEDFPKLVAEKKRRYRQRQKFVEAKFGEVARQLLVKTRQNAKALVAPVSTTPIHPWRLCPQGQHWVNPHQREGASVHGYCRRNPTRKDQLYADEMLEMASRHFGDSESNALPALKAYGNSSRFDPLIVGWTKYWNEIFKPSPLLDPRLVKALIASESSFRTSAQAKNRGNPARGLMQITDETRAILSDEKGELRDFLVNLTKDQAENPVLNIAAGVRWLFQKRRLAKARLKRTASWEEAAAEYKDVLRRKDARSRQIYQKLLNLYETLKTR